MEEIKTVQSVAQEMLDNLEHKTRDNGESFICSKKYINWQKEIIYKAHGDKSPDDYIYAFIEEALETLADCDAGSEEDAILEIEPDCYTSDLTKWLCSRNDRVYYITEVLEEYGDIKDVFQLLSMAQAKEKSEVAQAVLEGINAYIESEDKNERIS